MVDAPSEATRFWRRFEGGRGGQQLSLVKAQVFGEDSGEERVGQQLSLVKPQKSSLGGRLLCFPRVFSTADRSSGH